MARVVGTLTADLSGMQPMYASMNSLAEALSVAQFDGTIPLETCRDGLTFNDQLVASFNWSDIVDFTMRIRVVPTYRMPLFVEQVLRMAPGVKAHWRGGWPHFSAADGDDDCEDQPLPAAPNRLVPA